MVVMMFAISAPNLGNNLLQLLYFGLHFIFVTYCIGLLPSPGLGEIRTHSNEKRVINLAESIWENNKNLALKVFFLLLPKLPLHFKAEGEAFSRNFMMIFFTTAPPKKTAHLWRKIYSQQQSWPLLEAKVLESNRFLYFKQSILFRKLGTWYLSSSEKYLQG